jgi:flagellar hook protein FlgE
MIDNQGLLQSSSSATDLAINGTGFFVVNKLATPTATTGTYMYTRAGSFVPDEDGNLRNAAGYYLQGWPIDSSGNIPSNRSDLTVLDTVNIRGLTGTASATTSVSIQANLQASQSVNAAVSGATYTVGDIATDTVTADFERSVEIVDSQGGSRTMTMGFLKDTTANEWLVEIFIEPSTDSVLGATHPNGLVASGTVAFNTDGTWDLANTALVDGAGAAIAASGGDFPLSITWATALGLANSSVTLDLGTDADNDGMTQFDTASNLISTTVNGSVFGSLMGVQVDEDGIVTALFDNGTTQDIYKLAVATFPNPNGLGNQAGNGYIETESSGDFNLQEAGTGGSGTVAPSTLESSTVDLAEEFANMIVTQRAYSASGKIITTADEMLDELIRLKR